MRTLLSLLLAPLLVMLAACNPGGGDTRAAATVATAAGPSAASDADPADVTMRYDCGGGVGVFVLRGGKARAVIPGQTTVMLGMIADSKPAVYAGANLYFTIGADDAHLSQENGTELACHRQQARDAGR